MVSSECTFIRDFICEVAGDTSSECTAGFLQWQHDEQLLCISDKIFTNGYSHECMTVNAPYVDARMAQR